LEFEFQEVSRGYGTQSRGGIALSGVNRGKKPAKQKNWLARSAARKDELYDYTNPPEES